MMGKILTSNEILRVFKLLPPKRKKQLGFLVFFTFLTSLAEVVSISAVVPFLGAITAPEKVFVHNLAQPLVKLLSLQTPNDLLLPLTLIFMCAAISTGLMRVGLLWLQTRLSRTIGSELSVRAYERALFQPYSVHVSRNSSEILASTQKAAGLVGNLIQPTLIGFSSLVTVLAIGTVLMSLSPFVALSTFLILLLTYALVTSITKYRVAKNSQTIAEKQVRVTKTVQEGLGGIRDIIIDGKQVVYSNIYRDAIFSMQTAVASNQIAAGSPRFVIESLGIVLIAGLAYFLTAEGEGVGGINNAIPILGTFALGAQRLLPVTQQFYSAYITIKGNKTSAQNALDTLEQPMPAHPYAQPINSLPFQTAIFLKDLCFRYTPQGRWVLNQINLEIPKGSRVGFVGVTGSGKSTLLDIVMGLLTPTEGTLFIDSTPIDSRNTRDWQAHISHVPQTIYLSDTSIAENIAFGVPAELIDLQRLKQAAQEAQIAQTIEGWDKGYDTLVGERGVRLSGGQRQRVGIARALYRRAKVIVFDEATSALDNETEAAVMQAVETLGREITILIIAHRLTTLKNCDQILELANGAIKCIGGYDRMMSIPTKS